MEVKETLGSRIRANRLGFRELEGIGYVRCSDDIGSGVLIEVAQPNTLPTHRKCGHHRCWWEGEPKMHTELARRIKRRGLAGKTGQFTVT